VNVSNAHEQTARRDVKHDKNSSIKLKLR